jgi:hypothetical protein
MVADGVLWLCQAVKTLDKDSNLVPEIDLIAMTFRYYSIEQNKKQVEGVTQ